MRVPSAEIPVALVRAVGFPVTATSANLSGEGECTTADAVRQQLGDKLPLIVDGGTTPRVVASTIVDLTDEENGWRIIREGAIADILVVDGSPLDDINVLVDPARNIRLIMKEGDIYRCDSP